MQNTNNLELVVFDMDGTLMRSDLTIYKTMLRTFEDYNIQTEIPYDKFKDFIGFHFKDIFDYFNVEVGNLKDFINIYKGYYFNYIDDTFFYDGVLEGLSIIKNKGYKTAILTTKAQDQLEKIIDHFQLNDKFDFLCGRREGWQIKPHPEPLLKICEYLKVNPHNTLMVGDTWLDVECANAAGANSCFVEYGYGKYTEIKSNTKFTVKQFNNLVSDIL